MRGLIEFVRHATARHNSETEGTKTNAKQSLLGFKIDDNFRITSLTSQFVFKAESGKGQGGLFIKLILLLLVSTDTWQTTKCVRVQWLREGLQKGGHRDPLVRQLEQHLVLLLTL